MATSEFHPGDKVKHKSEGPPLVIVRLDEQHDMYVCQWYSNAEHKFVHDSFPEVALEEWGTEDGPSDIA